MALAILALSLQSRLVLISQRSTCLCLPSTGIKSVPHYCLATFLFLKTSCIWFCSRSLGYLVSCSWSIRQCQIWVLSLGVGFKSNQALVGYSYKLCTTIALAYFAGRTALYIKTFVARLVFMFFFRQPAEYLPIPKTLELRGEISM